MPQTLLLADDSVTIQRVIELTFADQDIKVVAVSDGDQAIERIEAEPPDIVLVDIGMPGRTGYEVARHIKQSPRLAHIPVVLLTGAFEPVDQAKAADVGCDGVLAKPFEPQLVIARVKELLGRASRAPEPVDAGRALHATQAVDLAVQPPVGPPVPASQRPPEVARLDNYFDGLNRAFTTFSKTAPSEPPQSAVQAPPAVDIDWFGESPTRLPAPPPPDLQLSYVPPAAPPAPDADLGREPNPRTAAPWPTLAPQLPPQAATLPPLADAFAALLAAEQHEPLPAVAPAWPTPPSSGGPLSDDVIEEVARRVLDRLSDRVVRETVADVVSTIAERLVREEIERIKS